MTLTSPLIETDASRQAELASIEPYLEFGNRVVARLAHDYGNIFTTLSGFLDLSLSQLPAQDSHLAGYMEEVRRACHDGVELTSRLRQLSRRQASIRNPCDVVEVLTAEVDRHSAEQSPRIRFTIDAQAPLPRVNCSEEAAATILGEVLQNAIRAISQEGSITISTSRIQISPDRQGEYLGNVSPGEHVEVVVTDTGSGMSPEVLRRLFREPFFTTRPKRGGYGLAMVYGQLHAHRGGLKLHSVEHEGTSVHLLFPAHTGATRAGKTPALSRPALKETGKK